MSAGIALFLVRRLRIAGLTGLALLLLACGEIRAQALPKLVETPSLEASVKAGLLPPVDQRVPEEPLIVDLPAQGLEIGRHGGSLRTLIDRPKSIRYMAVWGYARLVGYTPELELVPDILKDVKVENGNRVFTFTLRRGHKWSDGHPFTSEDFRYYWEDVANNPSLSPGGPPTSLVIKGEAPKFEVIDEVTVRYSWSRPNPTFLQELARARPTYIYMPAHYMRQFHEKYADPDQLARMVAAERVTDWAALHNRRETMYDFDNIELPTLEPWHNITLGPTTRFIMRRNPYFHRIDTRGQQLPYVDEVIMDVASPRLIPAKVAAGESDLQARGLNFSDLAVLKRNEKRSGYHVELWPSGKGAQFALYPDLNYADPVWRKLFRNPSFRRALSISIDRYLISRTLYLGLAKPASNFVLERSPLYDKELAGLWTQYSPEKANALLDEIGLTERDSSGYRLLPDGRRAEIVVETAGEDPEEVDILQLIAEDWAKIGIRLLIKPSMRDALRERAYTGQVMMTTWSGWDNGVPTPDMMPDELAPTHQDNLAWPKWGEYYETKGKSGEAPDVEEAKELIALYKQWFDATDSEQRAEIWRRMLKINAEQQFVIGVVAGVPQPVVVSNKLRNVPKDAFYGWDPGAQFGIYHPDQFWFAQ
ncbi:ABC transporter substrate-binding protein [Rhodoligotrophos defluvii]|uniref:ABC transporter substrate-binding protein n=1 Tax=Rhodoligotrophos defluvii TaxID=2561934 RepID=UPI0010C99B47|nr:ABC transporter substrate-binding protein [Rhodoligotrophos defluvii]